MNLKIQNRKIIFSVRKKITPTKKSLKIDRTPNLDTPRYRVYCLTPPELGDTVPKKNVDFFRILSPPRAGPLRPMLWGPFIVYFEHFVGVFDRKSEICLRS